MTEVCPRSTRKGGVCACTRKDFGLLEMCRDRDSRRTCARLCHAAGGELEQTQFLLGHVSVQTTERYLGCKQRIRGAVNDHIGIEPTNWSL